MRSGMQHSCRNEESYPGELFRGGLRVLRVLDRNGVKEIRSSTLLASCVIDEVMRGWRSHSTEFTSIGATQCLLPQFWLSTLAPARVGCWIGGGGGKRIHVPSM